jgi:hypothetical protein
VKECFDEEEAKCDAAIDESKLQLIPIIHVESFQHCLQELKYLALHESQD